MAFAVDLRPEEQVQVKLRDGRTMVGWYSNGVLTRVIGTSQIGLRFKEDEIISVEPSPAALALVEAAKAAKEAAKKESLERERQDNEAKRQARLEELNARDRQIRQRTEARNRALYWSERGKTFDPETMTATEMDAKAALLIQREEAEAAKAAQLKEAQRQLDQQKAAEERQAKERQQRQEEDRRLEAQKDAQKAEEDRVQYQTYKDAIDKEREKSNARMLEFQQKGTLYLICGAIFIFLLMFLPTFIAVVRKSPYATPIAIVSILWSIGTFIAMGFSVSLGGAVSPFINALGLPWPAVYIGCLAWATWPKKDKT